MKADPLRVAVLVDLARSPEAGGHVKCWERLAAGAAEGDLPLDLTVYFSVRGPDEPLGPHVRFRNLSPVFSTANLKFLPYVPDHTDLAPYHSRLARELAQYDVIHTTDGFFAFARTAEKVSRARGIPLVTSIHTDTPSYARIFTQQTIEKIFGKGWLGRRMVENWQWPEKQGQKMERRLRTHLAHCYAALAMRAEDRALAESVLVPAHVHYMRRGIDKTVYGPFQRHRAAVERDYGIPPGRIAVLFVGRVDVGKNIYTLIEAMARLIAEGLPLHLVVAGVGPAAVDVEKKLGNRVSLPGFVPPTELARLYASVDVLAVSSEVETHSMVAVEAITSGCPVLVSCKSGVAPLFGNTPAIETVESGVADWAAALRDFVAQPKKREAMRAAAVDYSCVHVASWHDVLAQDLLDVWQKAAGIPARRAAA